MNDLTRVPSRAPAVHRHHHALRRMRLAALLAATAGGTTLARPASDEHRHDMDWRTLWDRAGQPDTVRTFAGAVLGRQWGARISGAGLPDPMTVCR